ncbi:unnamed protein product [Choristocarpus tenellus]
MGVGDLWVSESMIGEEQNIIQVAEPTDGAFVGAATTNNPTMTSQASQGCILAENSLGTDKAEEDQYGEEVEQTQHWKGYVGEESDGEEEESMRLATRSMSRMKMGISKGGGASIFSATVDNPQPEGREQASAHTSTPEGKATHPPEFLGNRNVQAVEQPMPGPGKSIEGVRIHEEQADRALAVGQATETIGTTLQSDKWDLEGVGKGDLPKVNHDLGTGPWTGELALNQQVDGCNKDEQGATNLLVDSVQEDIMNPGEIKEVITNPVNTKVKSNSGSDEDSNLTDTSSLEDEAFWSDSQEEGRSGSNGLREDKGKDGSREVSEGVDADSGQGSTWDLPAKGVEEMGEAAGVHVRLDHAEETSAPALVEPGEGSGVKTRCVEGGSVKLNDQKSKTRDENWENENHNQLENKDLATQRGEDNTMMVDSSMMSSKSHEKDVEEEDLYDLDVIDDSSDEYSDF